MPFWNCSVLGGCCRPAERRRYFKPKNALALDTGSERIVGGLEGGNEVPIIVWKADHQEQPPDGQQRADILGMLEQGKRELSRPGDLVAKSITVKHSKISEAIEHACIEHLSYQDHRR